MSSQHFVMAVLLFPRMTVGRTFIVFTRWYRPVKSASYWLRAFNDYLPLVLTMSSRIQTSASSDRDATFHTLHIRLCVPFDRA
jgi:hypothetical protein